MCKRIFKEQTTEQGDVPFYKIGTFGGTPDAFISRELFDEYQRLYQFPKVGDILISAAGTIGRTIVYQGDPAYYQDSNIVWLQHDERLDNGFLLQFLNGKSWSSLEGSTLKRLYNKDLLDAEIAIPSPDEQHQIGSTFARLDDIITLHQRKRRKESFNRYPVWEQRKFSDVADVCSGKDYKHLEEGPIPVYGTGGFMTSVDEALSYDRDAVGIGRKGTIDKPYLLKAPFWTVDTLFYAIPKSDIDLEFAHCSFLNVDWKSKDESTGLPSLSKEAINETIVLVPSFNEQSRLGDLFNNLDNLITLHQ